MEVREGRAFFNGHGEVVDAEDFGVWDMSKFKLALKRSRPKVQKVLEQSLPEEPVVLPVPEESGEEVVYASLD